jgi:hypothetical protein
MRTRTRVLLAIAAVGVVALSFGLYWFQPWKLWVDHHVDEALPAVVFQTLDPSPTAAATGSQSAVASPPAAGPQLLSRGRLISHEHHTSGTVSVVLQPDGKRQLAIASLNTSDGPDVHVWLTDQHVTKDGWHVFDDGTYVDLGKLKGNIGNLLYSIPASADLAKLTSVSIWCDRFNVSFGAAELTPV